MSDVVEKALDRFLERYDGFEGSMPVDDLADYLGDVRTAAQETAAEITKLRAELAACRAEREGAVAALEPFAVEGDQYSSRRGDDEKVRPEFTIGNFRQARAAFHSSEPDGSRTGDA